MENPKELILENNIIMTILVRDDQTNQILFSTIFRIMKIIYDESEGIWIKINNIDDMINGKKNNKVNYNSDTDEGIIWIIEKSILTDFMKLLHKITISKKEGTANLQNIRFFIPSGSSPTSMDVLSSLSGVRYESINEIPNEYNNLRIIGWNILDDKKIIHMLYERTELLLEEAEKNISKFLNHENITDLEDLIDRIKKEKGDEIKKEDLDSLNTTKFAMQYFGYEQYGDFVVKKPPKNMKMIFDIMIKNESLDDLVRALVTITTSKQE